MRGIAAGLMFFLAAFADPSNAESVSENPPGVSVRIDALIENLRGRLEEHPDDADTLIQLGQLQNYVYGYGLEYVSASNTEETDGVVPRIPPTFSSNVVLPVSTSRVKRLAEALDALRRGVDLAPDNYTGRLALGFAYMEAARRCNAGDWIRDRVPVDEAAIDEVGERAYWENLSLECLRAARKSESDPEALAINPQQQPAAYYMFQILAGRGTRTEAEQAELDGLRKQALDFANALSLLVSIGGRPESNHEGNVSDAALAEVLAIYPFVPPSENAAEFYLRAMDGTIVFHFQELEESLPFFTQTEMPLPAEPLEEEMLQRIRDYLALYAEPLRLVHEGGKLSKSRYPIDMRQTQATLLPHLARLRQLTRLKALEALYAAESGNEADAVRAIQDAIALARSVRREPTLISQLVRISCTDIAARVVEQVLNRVAVSDSNLRKLLAEFGSLEDGEDMLAGLFGERWMWTIPISIVREDVREMVIDDKARKIWGENPSEYARLTISSGDVRLPDTTGIEATEEEMKAKEVELRAEQGELIKFQLENCDTAIALAKLPLTEMYQSVIALQEERSYDVDRGKGPDVPARERSLIAQARIIAKLRVTLIALAIERYRLRNGNIPDNLEPLVPEYIAAEILEDPFTGESLRYEIEEDHHVVYSVADAIFNERHTQRGGAGPSAISFSVYE